MCVCVCVFVLPEIFGLFDFFPPPLLQLCKLLSGHAQYFHTIIIRQIILCGSTFINNNLVFVRVRAKLV